MYGNHGAGLPVPQVTLNPQSLSVVRYLVQAYLKGDMPTPSASHTLSSTTLHTLYAASFIIYSINIASDWLNTYFTCKEGAATFPLQPWLVLVMVSSSFAGSVFVFLLLFLCIEQAFARRGMEQPYKGGFVMICQKMCVWFVSFDCFRIAFLVLLFEDAPMTFVNFWFLSSCRIANRNLSFWPVTFGSFGTILSLVWRLVMLAFAYKHFWFFQLSKNQLQQINRESSTIDEFRSIIGLKEERLTQYDECWPVRYSIWNVYKKVRPNRNESIFRQYANRPVNSNSQDAAQPTDVVLEHLDSESDSSAKNCYAQSAQACCCCFMCSGLYMALGFICCMPCCYHYTCKQNALFHRHRFAKTCTRMCATGFHIFVLLFSLVLAITLLIVNLMFLSSVQAIGHNLLPPELKQLCIQVDKKRQLVYPQFYPNFIDKYTNATYTLECKPIFDITPGTWGFNWNREKPVNWEMVEQIGENHQIVVITDVQTNRPEGSKPQGPQEEWYRPTIFYDVVLKKDGKCFPYEQSGWSLGRTKDLEIYWPYFSGCYETTQLKWKALLTCGKGIHAL